MYARALNSRFVTESHASLRDDYEVSIPQLDELVDIAVSAGGFGARLSGAGFGGAVLVLVDAEKALEVAEAIVGEYGRRTGVSEEAVVVRAAAGARIIPGR